MPRWWSTGLTCWGRTRSTGGRGACTPLGGGLTAVYRYDTSRLRMDPPGWGMRQRALQRRLLEAAPERLSAGVQADTGEVIDLMVVYTPEAAALGSIDLWIRHTLDITHTAYRESDIPIELGLVHSAPVRYTASAAMGHDLDLLSGQGDGWMDEVHTLRNEHRADLVALVVAQPSPDGVAGVGVEPAVPRRRPEHGGTRFQRHRPLGVERGLPGLHARSRAQPGRAARSVQLSVRVSDRTGLVHHEHGLRTL